MRNACVAKRNLAHRGRSLLKKRTKAIGSIVPMVRYASLDWTDGGRRNTGHRHVGTTASALSTFCMPNFNQGPADFTELSNLMPQQSRWVHSVRTGIARVQIGIHSTWCSATGGDKRSRRKVTCIPKRILSGFDPFAQSTTIKRQVLVYLSCMLHLTSCSAMSEGPVLFAPDAEPSSVLAVVRKEPRGQVVRLEKAWDLVRSSTAWGLLTSAGQRHRRIASRAVCSSWRDVPGLLLSIMKITGYV